MLAEPANAFRWQRRIGFGDCDPAQIAYTGRLIDIALQALDAFWGDLLDGEDWFRMHADMGYGMPFVRVECDFRSPVTPRAMLDCAVWPLALGRSSVTMAVAGGQGGVTCFTGRLVSVFATRAAGAGGLARLPVPAHIRAALVARWPDLAG